MKKRIAAILLTTLLPFIANAQLHFTGAIGGGLSYVKAKNLNTRFLPVARPNATLFASVLLTTSVAVQIGAGYTMKGYNTDQTEHFGPNKNVFSTKTQTHYLSLPLLLSFKAYNRPQSQLWIDGGMNYDLFLSGKTNYNFAMYESGEKKGNIGFSNKIAGRFSPNKYSSAGNTYDVNGLDVALKLQIRYIYRQKYSFAIYHEHSLYDMRNNIGDDATSSLKARYTGLSVGYIIF